MNLFTRDAITYDYDLSVVDCILQDDANPLRRICEIIPEHSRVLDVGAGNGLLAVVMKTFNKQVTIDGIEPDLHAANIAKSHYRNFWMGHVQDFRDTIHNERYDYIVMADVLEHFQDPQLFLQELVSLIPAETRIVLSMPNIAFGAVRLSLLKGQFRYVDSGILEKTHLRFFTLETLQELVASCGLGIEKLFFLQRDFLAADINHNVLDVGLLAFIKMLKDKNASTYQFLVVLSKVSVQTEIKYYGTGTHICFKDFIISAMRKFIK